MVLMLATILFIAILIFYVVVLGAITQWIVHKLNPPKNPNIKQEGIAKNFASNASAGFIITLVINALILFGAAGPMGAWFLIATFPTMIVFGLMSAARFVSR